MAASADALVVINLGAGEAILYDPTDFSVITKFQTGKEPHEIVVSSDGRVAYVANSGPQSEPGKTISVIDLRNRMVRGRINLGNYTLPHDLRLSRDDSILWVACAPARTVLEIETRTGKIVKEWKTDQEGGWMLAAAPDDRRIYVANMEGGSVSVIDRTGGNVNTIKLEAGPIGIDVSPDNREVWVSNNQKNLIYVIDARTDKVVATFDSGGQSPVRVKFTPDGKRVLVPNGQSKTLIVFDAAKRRIEATIPLSLAPKVITVSKDGRRAFVTNPADNQFTVVDIASRKEVNKLPISARPDGVVWANDSVRSTGQVAFKIPERDLIPEGIAYDPQTKTFFVGSTYKRKIVAVDSKGRTRDFITEAQDGFMGGVGMRVDAKRRVLWAISSDAGEGMPIKMMDEANNGRSGIFKYDLNTGKLIKKYLLDNKPQRHFLNDLTINSEGDVYITDSMYSAVYLISQTKDELEVFLRNEKWAFPNGIDFSDDEKNLFVSINGNVAVINVATRESRLLTLPDFDGSDGLYFYKNSLVAIDAYNDRMVVARYFLSKDFNRVDSFKVIERDHPLLIQPTTGVIVGSELYYIANSQLQHFRRLFKSDGSFPAGELNEVVILKSKL
jgi:YVTN family beta-propeller protein